MSCKKDRPSKIIASFLWIRKASPVSRLEEGRFQCPVRLHFKFLIPFHFFLFISLLSIFILRDHLHTLTIWYCFLLKVE